MVRVWAEQEALAVNVNSKDVRRRKSYHRTARRNLNHPAQRPTTFVPKLNFDGDKIG